METTSIRASRPTDGERVVEIWRAAVDATHHFLTPEDRAAIDVDACALLPHLPLWLAVDRNDGPLAFMALEQGCMAALFVDPAQRGAGVGRMLVEFALALFPVLTTDVNEQNGQAVGFYERLGFAPTGRSALDDQGRAYPLIHLRLYRWRYAPRLKYA
ncbi:MAG TPA: acetyltransferase [Burkholderiales bacterium]